MSYTSADDYSDNLSTTGNLIVGRQVFGAIELPNDKDWFKVTLQAGTVVIMLMELLIMVLAEIRAYPIRQPRQVIII